MRKIGNLTKNMRQRREFAEYLAQLHVQFKPKGNFIGMLHDVA